MKRTIKEIYTYRDREFIIIYNDEICPELTYRYFGIEKTDLDDYGRLLRPMSIGEMNGEATLDNCLERIHNRVDMDYYLGLGMSKAEALCRTFNIMDRLEDAKRIFD